ncbi:MAG: hypothetical protein GXP49_11010 [Deltaproteobacteria bacterium]|nr:hypothetical protein [Deltaproteobacteria bacterium]
MAEIKKGNKLDYLPPAIGPRGARRIDAAWIESKFKAEEMLSEARLAAEDIVKNAQSLLESAKREGERMGRAEAADQAAQLIAKAKVEASRIISGAETQLLKLSVKIAEQIVGKELELSGDAVTHLVSQVLNQAKTGTGLCLRLNPLDADALNKRVQRLRMLVPDAPKIEIAEDPSMSRGGCVVSGADLEIDARLETRLEEIEKILLGGGRVDG